MRQEHCGLTAQQHSSRTRRSSLSLSLSLSLSGLQLNCRVCMTDIYLDSHYHIIMVLSQKCRPQSRRVFHSYHNHICLFSSACLPACLPVCLSVCLLVCIYVCLCAWEEPPAGQGEGKSRHGRSNDNFDPKRCVCVNKTASHAVFPGCCGTP